MQPYPWSPDLVWPGQLQGTGCLSARALDTGFPTVVWCLCLGPGCGWVWVLVTPPVLAGVSGGCVRVRFVVSSLFYRLGFVVFAVGLGLRPAPHLSWLGVWDVCGCVRALPAPRRFRFRCAVWACVLASGFRLRPATPWGGVGVCVCSCTRPAWSPAPPGWGCCAGVCGWCRAPPLLAGASGSVCVCARAPLVPHLSGLGCAVWACVLGPGLGCAPPFSVGLSGCVFFYFFLGRACLALALWCQSLAVPVPGLVVPAPPSPLFRAGMLALFFFVPVWCVSARFGCPSSRWAAAPGFVLPVFTRWSPCAPLGGPVFRALWVGGLAASCGVGGQFGGCGPFSRPPPLFFFCFFRGGVYLFLPLPSLGWRTHWPAFSVVFRVAVGGCVLLGCVPAPWVGWVTYTLGSAPLPTGFGPGSACWAAAAGGFVWLSVRGGWGCLCPVSSAVALLTFPVDRHRCCRAHGGPVWGPRCWCVARWCGALRGVRRLVLVCPSG